MLKIEVVEQKVQERPRRDRTKGTYRVQEAFLHKTGGKYPEAFDLPLGKDARGNDAPAWPPGVYELDADTAFKVFARRLEFWPSIKPARVAPRAATA